MTELRLLGPVEVRTGDGPVSAGEPRRLAVLAALLIDAGQVVPAATLIDRVWGEDPPAQAGKTLGTYVTRIRRLLEQAFHDETVEVVNQQGGYRLTARRDQIDLFCFRDLVVRARDESCTPQRRVDLLRQAVSLWRGDPLTGVGGEWAERIREQLTGERLAATAEWADAELAVGNAAAVLAPLTALADAYPLMEPLLAALIRALVAAGRPTEALERCRAHQRRLVEEYGTDPSPQLRALYEEILRGEEVAPAPPVRVTTPVAAALPDRHPVLTTARRAGQTATGTTSPSSATGAGREQRAAGSSAAPTAYDVPVDPPAPRRSVRRRGAAVLAAGAVVLLAFGAGALTRDRQPAVRHDTGAARATPVTEEFSGSELSPQWAAYGSQRHNGSAWSPTMVRVDGGELQLTGTGRNPTGAGNLAGAVCWCHKNVNAPVHQYGKWEVRAKVDAGVGYGAVMGLYPDFDDDDPDWAFLTMARLDQGARTSMYPEVGDHRNGTVTGSAVTGDYTTWNTYAIEWRSGFATVSLNGNVIFDTRKAAPKVHIPSSPMWLYIQLVPGPDGPVPRAQPDTPTQVVAHVDWARYTP